MVAAALSVLVLTEDTAADAHATVTAIAKRVLFLLEPALDGERLSFDRADERARAGMGFNCYKSRNQRDHRKKVALVQAIATHLLRADGPTAVLVHIDADRPWAGDHDVACENVTRFHEAVLGPVATLLAQKGRRDRLAHLALLVPFWSIESWLYQNTTEALKICQEQHPRHASAVTQLEGWRDAPHTLDAHPQPKDATTLGSKYNRRLAESSFPARRVYGLGLSFTHSVDHARAGLATLLRDLRRSPAADGP